MKIAQVTDLHLDDFLSKKFNLDTCANIERILSDIHARNIQYVVLTGDFGSPEKYQWLTALLDRYEFDFDIILGNHDKSEGKLQLLEKERLADSSFIKGNEYYYSKVISGLKVIFLDTGAGTTSDGQKLWLEAELKTSSDTVVVFAHHPILDCNTAMDKSMVLRDRDVIANILHNSRREIYLFCGHYHFTHECSEKSVHQFVTPATIMQIRSENDQIVSASFDFGYRIIDITPEVIATTTNMFISQRMVKPGE